MKMPRDINGIHLAGKLAKFGYEITRQSGSHIRLNTLINGEHHITIPAHNPIKIGTLSAIFNDIAFHFGITKEELLDKLY